VETDRIKIILVDNRTSNRRGLKAILAFEPKIVIVGEAEGGKEAIRLVEKHQPNLVLMDIHMPDMDGLAATQIIKSTWSEVKIILYSVNPGYQEDAMKVGADYFLIKGGPDTSPSEVILSLFPQQV
jgi:YesN/AraC family two-component response regulator